MQKRMVVALLVGMGLGFGIPVALTKYADFRQARLAEAGRRAAIARVADKQRAAAEDFRAVTAGKGRLELLNLAPPEQGVGISYQVALKEEDEKRAIVGVLVSEVFRDSAAGRAGVLPGDWVVSIGETALCNLLINREEQKTRDVRGDSEKLLSTAAKLFAESGDTYTVTVDRAGTEKQFRLTRGPVAPEVAKFVHEHLDGWNTYLEGLNGEAMAVATEVAKPAVTSDDINGRRDRLNSLQEKIDVPWVQLKEFTDSSNATIVGTKIVQ